MPEENRERSGGEGGAGRGVRSVRSPFRIVPKGRGTSVGECSGRVDSPLFGGEGHGGFLHHDQRWGSTAFRRCPAPTSGYLSETSGHFRLPGESDLGLHSGLDSRWLCPGVFPSHSSTLFQDVFRSKGSYGPEAHNRSFGLKQAAQESQLQDGRPREGGKVSIPWVVGSQVGSEGCLPSFTPRLGSGKILRLCPGEEDLRFSGPPFWSFPCSMALHQSPKARKKGFTSFGDSDYLLSRRLPDFSQVSAGSVGARQDSHWAPTETGFPNKLEEVSSGPPTALGVSGGHSQSRRDDFFPPTGEGRASSFSRTILGKSLPKEIGVGIPCGFPQLHSGLPSLGKAMDEASTGVDEFSLISSRSSGVDSHGLRAQGGSPSLGRQGLPGVLRSDATGLPFSGPDDRRLHVGLGRGCCSSPGLRFLGSSSEGQVHQLVGVEGNPPVAAPFQTSSGGEMCVFEGGQYNSPRLHQEAGLSDLSRALGSLSRDFDLGLAVKYSPGPSAPARGLECLSRQGLSGVSGLNRVVSRPVDFRVPLRGTWRSPSGPDGNLGKSQDCTVRLSLSGRQGLWDRRLQLRLESMDLGLPVPSVPVAAGGCSAVGELQGQGVSDCSPLALSPLVLPPGREVSCQDSPQGGSPAVSVHFQRGSFPPRGASVQPSRLAFMKTSLENDGFSEAATDLFLSCHKPSTRSQYQSTWVKFLRFLDSAGVHPSEVGLCHVHNFLAEEAVVHGKAYRTVATYKCALALPLRITRNLDLENVQTSKFMMGVWNLNPPRPRPLPVWDLSALLSFVRSDLFEDLREVSFELLTQKVLVLLLVASGRRLSEIANLSRITSVHDSRTYVHWLPDFKAKWCSGFSMFTPQSPSFSRMDSAVERHLRNCPVRALEIFLYRRKSVVGCHNDDCFWTIPQTGLAAAFRSVVRSSLLHHGVSSDVAIFPHQTKKLAVSYCWKYFDKDIVLKELPTRVGNSSIRVLKGSYLGSVPDITLPTVVPLGTIRPSR